MAGPCVLSRSHRFAAAHLATKVHVAQAIWARLGPRIERMKIMSGGEALEGVTSLGRVDIRGLFDLQTGL